MNQMEIMTRQEVPAKFKLPILEIGLVLGLVEKQKELKELQFVVCS